MVKEICVKPTKKLIAEKNEDWNKELKFYGPEMILNKLFLATGNHDFREVYTKCHYLNRLYSTRISNIDVERIAKHIVNTTHFDNLIKDGNTKAVVEIAFNSDTKNKNFSFASKYCSFCNPIEYPIYDTLVEKAIWQYQKDGILKSYKRSLIKENNDGVNRYKIFKSKIDELIENLDLKSTYKELDHFLWLKNYIEK
ncbi:hypothetical protein JZO81_02850 [Enterococcus hulanensis]|uniref:hypothetical protein n=1 Tax=Enterococcus hulanensis TaxID=2559929 RepID=UPI001A914979|nr:hypothetical protein [Enterococcus hulanensis]MBO0409975.1 hypothetical protein [Enterococcus hulanensis]